MAAAGRQQAVARWPRWVTAAIRGVLKLGRLCHIACHCDSASLSSSGRLGEVCDEALHHTALPIPYYAINPSGRVPYLIRDDGVGMEGSGSICAYLDQLDGAPSFAWPPGARGWELRRLEALARSLMDGITVWGRELRHRPEEERSPRIIEHERQRSRRLADLWEGEIESPLMRGELGLGASASRG